MHNLTLSVLDFKRYISLALIYIQSKTVFTVRKTRTVTRKTTESIQETLKKD
jgi:hypothetical protein